MKTKSENAAADASRRPGRVRGARKFGILSAMGLVAATALVGADCVVNSFVTVEGEGARAAADGSIHFANATGPVSVEVTARPGWKVEGRPSLSTVHFPGGSETLRVTSDLGEDSGLVSFEDCQFGSVVSNRHVVPPGIGAEACEARILKLYVLPETNILVSAAATCETLSNGLHEVTTTWLPCGLCGATHDPTNKTDSVSVEPGEKSWTASFAGASTNDSVWTGYMAKGVGQVVDFSVVATNECAQCVCQSETNAVVDVHELSVTNALFVGLDRTDGGRANPLANAKLATALIDPEPSGTVSYSWTDCGICTFTGRTDEVSAQYFAPDPDTASDSYLKEELKVEVAVTNDWGISDSAICKTNFTVVLVDVEIGGADEEHEEKLGAFLPCVPDTTNGVISVEGTNKMVNVSFSCEPALPTNEMVTVSCAGPAELYEKLATGELVKITSTNYPACEIASHVFKLHGHDPSGSWKDGIITIDHLASEATDMARYTSVKVDVEITDFPTKVLLGEDKEEMPGAFIPYAADWAYGEDQSNNYDIPFGPSAREKLVEVFVSYEPADLPEDEDRSVKFLEFEAPPDSLYLPAESAGADQRWIEFLNWWNTRPPSWGMTFEGKKRLLLHGHEKSDSQRDRVIRVTHTKSGATDMAKYTVFHVDLDIDSDNDLSIEREDGFEDAIEEREPGKIISWDQSGISPGQDYRVPLQLRAWGGETNAVVRIESNASSPQVADIYLSETGGYKLDLPLYFPADSIPPLYVDGVTNGTISFKATLINPPAGVSAASSVRPISGLELAEDKVAALVIQPISFSPGGGAAVWSSIPHGPEGVLDGDGVIFDSLISNQGYKVTWYRDVNGAGDLDIGTCTANAYLNLDSYGAVTIISHGDVDEHLAVYFPETADGCNAASNWIARIQDGGGHVSDMTVERERNWCYYVSVKPRWFENNWKPGFDRRNSVILWGSCYSASLLNCCGGRWRSGYVNPTDEGECSVVNSQFLARMNGVIGAGALRPAGMAYSHGRSSMSNNVRMEGIPWTTLCPAPIIETPRFPSSNLAEGDVAFGCLLLDTFVKEKSNMVKVIAGDEVYGIAPLRQEGAEYPFGVGFRIKKGSGSIKVRSEGMKAYIESATPNDEFASGKTMDADWITPNGGPVEWAF